MTNPSDVLAAGVDAVLTLHKPVELEPSDTVCSECSPADIDGHRSYSPAWPCPTVQALIDAGVEVEG